MRTIKNISSKIRAGFVASMMMASMAFAFAPVSMALDCSQPPDQGTPKCEVRAGVRGAGGTGAANSATGFTNLIQDIINILLFVIGAVAVIMIIIGGIRYTTSNGDQSQVTAAKNTILYAVVGLVVAIMAYAIVNFIVARL